MNGNTTRIESLIESAKTYLETTAKVCKLHAIEKSADIVSSFLSRLAVFLVFTLVVLMLNIGVAYWIGESLGKTSYGFFLVGGFYALITILFYIFRQQWVKVPLNNSIIIWFRKRMIL